MSRKKKTEATPLLTEPVVTKGNHLTVTKHPNGATDLVWDWDALLAEVTLVTTGIESLVKTTEEKVKKTRASKVASTVVEVVKKTATKVKKAVKEVIESTPVKKPRKKKGE